MRMSNHKLGILLICIASITAGCSTVDTGSATTTVVNKTLVLDATLPARSSAPLRVSSATFSAPKAGTVVFSYVDVTPPIYVYGAMIPGGRKRADVIYALERDMEQSTSRAMTQIFATDREAPASITGQLRVQFSDVTNPERRSTSSSLDVAVSLTLDLEVTKTSTAIYRRTYAAQQTDTSSGLLVTFPSSSFLNTLFTGALAELSASVAEDNALANALAP